MPGYPIVGPDEGTGLLPWTWAVERLTGSTDYWLATVRDDGRPHVMPVWGLWIDDRVWFSSGLASRKARNLLRDPRCTITTDRGTEPVVVDGTADRVTDAAPIATYAAGINAKYDVDIAVDFYDPAHNALFAVTPTTVIGMVEEDFGGSPTRWSF
jgi:PPOX class probable F420-dependent enzyme